MKTFTVSCLLLLLAVATGQTCAPTESFRQMYGLETIASKTPQNLTGLNYCKSLKSAAVCCSADAINSIQDMADEFITTLTAVIGARDRYLISIRNDVIPGLKDIMAAFVTQADRFVATYEYQAGISTDMDGVVLDNPHLNLTNITDIEIIYELVDFLDVVATLMTDNYGLLLSNFTTYQNSRASCVVEMVRLQSAAWCLACDPYATSKGYNSISEEIALSSTVCNRLQGSCYDYVTLSGNQNMILAANIYASFFDDFTGFIQGILEGNASDANGFLQDDEEQEEAEEEEEKEEQEEDYNSVDDQDNTLLLLEIIAEPADTPDNCDNGSCNWICDGLWASVYVDPIGLITGGVMAGNNNNGSTDDTNVNSTQRILVQRLMKSPLYGPRKLQQKGRMLPNTQSSPFNPSTDEAGVNVAFSSDPGNVNKSANMIKAGFVCVVMIILSIFA